MNNLQWIRQAKLTVETNTSNSSAQNSDVIELSDLRFRFHIQRATIQNPNQADIRIYNLSDNTSNDLMNSVSKMDLSSPKRIITIQAGYSESSIGVIFRGEIIQARRGRESQTDTYVDILAFDGDFAYTQGYVSLTIAAGSSAKDQIKAVADTLKQFGITYEESEIPSVLANNSFPRAVTYNGMAHNILRKLGLAYGFNWSIQEGKLTIVMHGDSIPGDAVVLNSETGLIGLPEQTAGGIMARCLINPGITPGCKIQIDQKSIQRQRLNLGFTPSAVEENAFRPSVAADGVYNVLSVEYDGDTRGTNWYQTITALIPGELLPSTRGIIPQ